MTTSISTELKKIQKILEDFEQRISQLEGIPRKISGKTKRPKEGISEYILEMKKNGFFNSSKLLGEINKELERRGHHYNTTSITHPLQGLIHQKKLERIGKKGKWQYVSKRS